MKNEQLNVDELNHLPDQEQAEKIAEKFASIQKKPNRPPKNGTPKNNANILNKNMAVFWVTPCYMILG